MSNTFKSAILAICTVAALGTGLTAGGGVLTASKAMAQANGGAGNGGGVGGGAGTGGGSNGFSPNYEMLQYNTANPDPERPRRNREPHALCNEALTERAGHVIRCTIRR